MHTPLLSREGGSASTGDRKTDGSVPTPTLVSIPTSQSLRELRTTRERFLADPASADLRGVREIIARSWRRSVSCRVDPESAEYGQREVQLDRTFMDIARPVLDRLEAVGHDTGVCIVLSDAKSTIASLRGDRDVIRWAGRHLVSVGRHLPEELAGTNGGGTAIEEGRSLQVWGAEHFAEELQTSFCTSVPIRDPLRARTIAVLSLMVPEKVALRTDPRSLVLVIEGAAAEIGRALLDGVAAREVALLRAYLRESRTRGGDAVVAIDERTTITSASARSLLAASDQWTLEAYAREAAEVGGTIERVVRLSSDTPIRLTAKPVLMDGATIGSVVRIRETSTSDRHRYTNDDATTRTLPTLIGDSAIMRRVRKDVEAAKARSITWVLGERGVGRGFLAELISGNSEKPAVVECDRSRRGRDGDPVLTLREAVASAQPVICRDVDKLSESEQIACADLLGDLDQGVRLVLTSYEVIPGLIPAAASAFELRMPPLRSRLVDVPALVAFFLNEDFPGRELSATPRLLTAFAQAHWPGNVTQLRGVVRSAGQSADSDHISLSDLGDSQRRIIARGRLSRLEAAELEQIRDALVEANGRKSVAADILEIGRSTLYRKMDRYTDMGYDLGQ